MKIGYTIHHIITDAWSMDILTEELVNLYHSYANNIDYSLEELEIQYSDYAHWQNDLIRDGELDEQFDYWVKELSGDFEEIEFPLDYPRRQESNYEAKMVQIKVDDDVFKNIRELCKKLNVSNYMFLLSAFNVLLYKYTNCNDIIVGSSTSGRVHPELNNIMGCFVNTLPIKNNVSSEDTFKDVLYKCKKKVLELYDNQEVPFNKILERLNVPREENKNPIFNTIFELHNWKIENKYLDNAKNAKGLVFEPCKYEINNSAFDMQFELSQQGNTLSGFILYSTQIYKESTINRIADNYIKLLSSIVEDVEIKILDIDIISESEKKKLNSFNQNDIEFPVDRCLHQLFEEQVQKTPDKIAVTFEGRELTYNDLNKKSNQLANLLRLKGVKNNKFVAVICDKSIELLISILAVFKAGGAYIPIDPSLPQDRIDYIVKNSQVTAVLTQSKYIQNVADKSNTYICVDEFNDNNLEYEILDKKLINECSCENLENINEPTDLAYAIYTSGSTGMPKGAMIRHNGMVNHIYAKIKDLNLNDRDVVLQNASISFDISVWQLLAALLVGGKTAIVSLETSRDVELLFNYIKKEKVTIFEIVPTLLSVFLDVVEKKSEQDRKLNKLRYTIVTGEEVSVNLVNRWFEHYKEVNIVNAYGPTEASDDITHYIIKDKFSEDVRRVSIGKPISNMKIYILDKYNKLAPIGVKGEICVTGIGVGAGYLNNESKTKESFIENSFEKDSKYLVYKTGDLGRWNENGLIDFFGRKDNQIKLRGFRIELEEIDSVSESYECIEKLVTVIKKENNDSKIVAYFTTNEENDFNLDKFKEYLKSKIPYYMIPAKFIKIDSIPLTSNGKVDRKLLENYSGGEVFNSKEEINKFEVRTETESKVIEIWKEVLSVDDIGINSDFFEIGGHSVTILKVASRIKEIYEVDIPVKCLFENTTVKQLAKYIDKLILEDIKDIRDENPIIKLPKQDYYELAPVQIPEWFLHELEPDNPFYNVTFDFILKGNLNLKAFEYSWKKLVERHEILRVSFDNIDGKPILRENTEVIFDMDKVFEKCQVLNEEDEKEKIKAYVYKYANISFDFKKGPIFNVKLIQINPQKHLLLFTAHHIIWDETSSMNLMKEFNELYNSYTENREAVLPNLEVNYLDYARWMNNSIKNGLFDKQKKYWLDKFKNVPEGLNLPADYLRPTIQTFNGGTILKTIDSSLKMKIDEFCKSNNVTLYMLCLAVLNLQMYRLSQSKDFVIGSPIVNRDDIHLENILGLFASAIPLRCSIDEKDTFNTLLNKTKLTAIEAYENHLYPSNLAIEDINTKADLSRSKLFNVFFGVQNDKNNLIENMKFNDLEIDYRVVDFIEISSRFDITLAVDELEGNIELNLNYNSDIFKKSTAERMINEYITILEQIVDEPNKLLDDYEIIPAKERKFILEEVNNTKMQFDEEICVHNKFEQQVELSKDQTALISKDINISYKELNERANKLANYLINHNVKIEDKIGIIMKPSIEMIVSLLATLKAGAACVPMTYEYPSERKKAIIEDAKIEVILTCSDHDCEEIDFNGEIICLDRDWNKLDKESAFNPDVKMNSHNLAYVIFTSGTTGKPKGIEIEHRGIINLLDWTQNKYQLTEKDTIIFVTLFTFDVSILDIYWPLLYGIKMVIADEEERRSPIEIGKIIHKNNVSVMQVVPSMLDAFVNASKNNEFEKIETLRLVVNGGATLTRELKDKFVSEFPKAKLFNHYGQTEATVDVLSFDSSEEFEGDVVPIGKPANNAKIYILDSNLKIVPIGVPGEIYIESVGLARSYLNDKEKTQRSFIPNPFDKDGNSRLYKTGDVAKYLEDGNIVFISRLDNQVKILGNRIELDEIEN
ncbi:MAG: amino acid adenylation domain-containing protein, partial [Clostridium sp.]|nr:amino acid adenylation domain-containing protein [Clostridium sp.]